MSTPAYQELCEILTRMLRYAEYPDEDIEKFLTAHGRDAAVLPPHEVASIIAPSDFNSPVLFLQTLFMHAWYTQRTSLD
ncbi:MAG: hypothetical protein AAGA75_10435 [Cyanobacteria bacterium P01_E01_bin.6]